MTSYSELEFALNDAIRRGYSGQTIAHLESRAKKAAAETETETETETAPETSSGSKHESNPAYDVGDHMLTCNPCNGIPGTCTRVSADPAPAPLSDSTLEAIDHARRALQAAAREVVHDGRGSGDDVFETIMAAVDHMETIHRVESAATTRAYGH